MLSWTIHSLWCYVLQMLLHLETIKLTFIFVSEQTQSDELKSSNHIVSHELIGDHYAKNGIIQTYQEFTIT